MSVPSREIETTFIGRESALERLQRALKEGARLVSLSGPEGTGKSRLARQLLCLNRRHFERHGGGAHICDLTDASTPDEVVERISRLLDADLSFERPDEAPDVLGEALASRGLMLLVLDGADRALDAVRALAPRLFLVAPLLQLIVTARTPLGAPGELRLKLGPLRVPPKSVASVEELLRFEAVQLFLERARQAVRGYTLDPTEAHAVAEIVRRLEGIPLAIELAAARVAAFSPTELLERLPRRVDLLKPPPQEREEAPSPSSRRARAKRSRLSKARTGSLKSTIEWSWKLLQPWEQTALAHASVFCGGFTEKAAEAVIDLSAFEGAPDVPDALLSLCQKSLLRISEGGEVPERRYLHYPSVRDFAEDFLEKSGEADRVRARHARYFVALGASLAGGVDEKGGLERRRRLEREAENLLQVVKGALRKDPVTVADVTCALEGLCALEPVLTTRGPFDAHVALLDAALEPGEVLGVHRALLARAFESRARALRARGNFEKSLADLEKALGLAREAKDRLLEARAIANIGTHHLLVGDLAAAEERYHEAIALLREIGAKPIEARALAFYGQLAQRKGKLRVALAFYEQALERMREVGDRRYEGITLGNLAALLVEEGALDKATPLLERALAIHREVGNRRFEAEALRELGSARLEQGDIARAEKALRAAVSLHREVLDRPGEARASMRLADLALERGQLEEARSFYGRALQLARARYDSRQVALLAARAAALDALLGVRDLSEARLADAEALLSGDDAVADVVRAFRDLAKTALSEGDPDWDDADTAPGPPTKAGAPSCTSIRADVRWARRALAVMCRHL